MCSLDQFLRGRGSGTGGDHDGGVHAGHYPGRRRLRVPPPPNRWPWHARRTDEGLL